MLKGFDNYPPACFVFCGRFCSAYGSSHLPKLKQGLSDLSNIITKFPNITEELVDDKYWLFVKFQFKFLTKSKHILLVVKDIKVCPV